MELIAKFKELELENDLSIETINELKKGEDIDWTSLKNCMNTMIIYALCNKYSLSFFKKI